MKKRNINNTFYDELGDRWHEDDRHAIALLRAESKIRLAYLMERTAAGDRIADIGGGAGLLAHPLSESGRRLLLLDRSLSSLRALPPHIPAEARAQGVHGDAFALPLRTGAFDAALLMDVLEHVERPAAMIREAARLLRPDGRLFFHTFNRTIMARLLAVHGMRVLMPDCPSGVHVGRLFIRPGELRGMCADAGLAVVEMTGLRPSLFTRAAVASLLRRRLDPDFSFELTRSLAVGYMGMAVREGEG